MPGFFSKVGTYLAGGGNAIGRAAMGRSGRAAQGAVIGAAAGGLYGAMSSGTSVLGGMAMGAGLGAGGARYGGRGMDIARLARGDGMGLGRTGALAGMGAGRLMARDARLGYRYARMRTNRAANTIKGIRKGMGFAMGGGLA